MFARHYLRNLGWFLFLRVLRWFSSPGSLLLPYVFRQGYRTEYGGFPHSDIAGSLLYCQLPHAFRRLTRPSSPIIAKASTWCTYSLDSIIWRTFWLCNDHRWLVTLLRFSTLTKLTAVVVYCSCLLCLRNNSIQSSPKFFWCVSLFQKRQLLDSSEMNSIRLQPYLVQTHQHCLCLLISAFQFVKDRCASNSCESNFANQNELRIVAANFDL